MTRCCARSDSRKRSGGSGRPSRNARSRHEIDSSCYFDFVDNYGGLYSTYYWRRRLLATVGSCDRLRSRWSDDSCAYFGSISLLVVDVSFFAAGDQLIRQGMTPERLPIRKSSRGTTSNKKTVAESHRYDFCESKSLSSV